MIQRPWDGAFDEYLTYALRDQNASRAAPGVRAEVHRRRPQGLRRRRHRAGSLHRRAGRRLQPDARSRALLLRPRRVHRASPSASRRKATRGRPRSPAATHKVAPGWDVTDAMVEEFRDYLDRRARQGRRGGVQDRPAVHQGDDPLRSRRRPVRRRRSAPQPVARSIRRCRPRSATSTRPRSCSTAKKTHSQVPSLVSAHIRCL